MSGQKSYRDDFGKGFAKGYSRYEKASWRQMRKVLPTAADQMIRLDNDISLLYDSFEQYGYATSILCMAIRNYPGEVFSQETLYNVFGVVFASIHPLAQTEFRAVLEVQITIFRDRNEPLDSAVLNRMTKLEHDYLL